MKTTITHRDLTLILGIVIGCIVIVLMMFREPASVSYLPTQASSYHLFDLTKLHIPLTTAIKAVF